MEEIGFYHIRKGEGGVVNSWGVAAFAVSYDRQSQEACYTDKKRESMHYWRCLLRRWSSQVKWVSEWGSESVEVVWDCQDMRIQKTLVAESRKGWFSTSCCVIEHETITHLWLQSPRDSNKCSHEVLWEEWVCCDYFLLSLKGLSFLGKVLSHVRRKYIHIEKAQALRYDSSLRTAIGLTGSVPSQVVDVSTQLVITVVITEGKHTRWADL